MGQVKAAVFATLLRVDDVDAAEYGPLLAARRQRRERAQRVFGASRLGDAVNAFDGVRVEWRGPDSLRPLLVPALLDKVLMNLRPLMKDEGMALLARAHGQVERSVQNGRPADLYARLLPLVHLDDVEILGTGLSSTVPATPTYNELLETAMAAGRLPKALAAVEVELVLWPRGERLMAGLRFGRPKAANARVAECVFWACWDRALSWLAPCGVSGEQQIIRLLGTIADMCDVYRATDLPRMREMGRVPFHAAATNGLLPSHTDVF